MALVMENMTDNNHELHCLECGALLTYGRPDRKFCSPQCKNRWHNRKSRQWHYRQARILSILERNHTILDHLLRMGVKTMEKPFLAQLGYRFDYVTTYRKVRNRNEFRCFDIQYVDTPSRLTGIALVPSGEDGFDPEGV